MQKTFLLVLSLLVLAGCKKPDDTPTERECGVSCTDRPMSIALSTGDYTDEEMDTVILKRYEGGSNFSQLIDSTLKIVPPDTGQYTSEHIATVESNVYGDDSDLEVVIPGAGQVYRVWDIKAVNEVRTFKSDNCNYLQFHYHCDNPVKDFMLSGGNFETAPGGAYTIILKH